MFAGRLDRYISIQSKIVTQSDSGEPAETWFTVDAMRPASVRPAAGAERFRQPSTVASEEVEFQIRWSANVAAMSPQYRIIYPAMSGEPAERDIYDILAVHEIGRREGLQIIAKRRPDVVP